MLSFTPEFLLSYKKEFTDRKNEIESEEESDSEKEKSEESEKSENEDSDSKSEMKENESEDEDKNEEDQSEDDDFGTGNQILYKMIGFLVEDEEENRYLYFYDKEKDQFLRSDGLDYKSSEEFKVLDIVVGFYEKTEDV